MKVRANLVIRFPLSLFLSAVAVAFESLSGESVEVYVRGYGSEPDDIYYQTRNVDGTLAAGPNSSGKVLNLSCTSLSLYADPKSDRIMLLAQSGYKEHSSQLDAILWDGSSWTMQKKLENGGTGEDRGNQPFTFVWD